MRSKKVRKEAASAKKKKNVNKKNSKDAADSEGKKSKGKKVPGSGHRDGNGEEFWEVSIVLFLFLYFSFLFCVCVFCGIVVW